MYDFNLMVDLKNSNKLGNMTFNLPFKNAYMSIFSEFVGDSPQQYFTITNKDTGEQSGAFPHFNGTSPDLSGDPVLAGSTITIPRDPGAFTQFVENVDHITSTGFLGEVREWANELWNDAQGLPIDGAAVTLTEATIVGAKNSVTYTSAWMRSFGAVKGGGAVDDLVYVYRGTGRIAENDILSETGYILSDAAQQAYKSSGRVDGAISSSAKTHGEWIDIWGSEANYAQAHSAFGTELPAAFGKDRTLISVTTDFDRAVSFAGITGSYMAGMFRARN